VGGRPAPYVVKLSRAAQESWRDWCDSHYQEQEADDFPEALEGPWGKLEAYAARLALILHLMHLDGDPTRSAVDDLPPVPHRIIDDAAQLLGYLKCQWRRVFAALSGKSDYGGEDVRALVRWILRNDLAKFTERDIHRIFDRFKAAPAGL